MHRAAGERLYCLVSLVGEFDALAPSVRGGEIPIKSMETRY